MLSFHFLTSEQLLFKSGMKNNQLHGAVPHGALYVAGPMTFCVSPEQFEKRCGGDPARLADVGEEADLNWPTFNKIATNLRAAGFSVVNPPELEANKRYAPGQSNVPVSDPSVWVACMTHDLEAMEKENCKTIVLTPPSRTVFNTLRDWTDSSGVCLEIVRAVQIGAEFIQANFNDRGEIEYQPVSREQIVALLQQTKTFQNLAQGFQTDVPQILPAFGPVTPSPGDGIEPDVILQDSEELEPELADSVKL